MWQAQIGRCGPISREHRIQKEPSHGGNAVHAATAGHAEILIVHAVAAIEQRRSFRKLPELLREPG